MSRIITFFLTLFLAVNPAYCQKVTVREMNIYYDALELEAALPDNLTDEEYKARNEEFVRKHGMTLDELDDIMWAAVVDRPDAPLTGRQEKVTEELKSRFSSYAGNPPRNVLYPACCELAAKYNMRPGEVIDLYYRTAPQPPHDS